MQALGAGGAGARQEAHRMKKYIQHDCLNSLRRFPRWLGSLPSSRPRGLSSPSLSFESPGSLLQTPSYPPVLLPVWIRSR